jgi:hypothetical protein
MTSEFNFGVGPLYNDLGDPYANMAKNDYENIGFLYRKPEPTNSILYSILQSEKSTDSVKPPTNYFMNNNVRTNTKFYSKNSK